MVYCKLKYGKNYRILLLKQDQILQNVLVKKKSIKLLKQQVNSQEAKSLIKLQKPKPVLDVNTKAFVAEIYFRRNDRRNFEQIIK